MRINLFNNFFRPVFLSIAICLTACSRTTFFSSEKRTAFTNSSTSIQISSDLESNSSYETASSFCSAGLDSSPCENYSSCNISSSFNSSNRHHYFSFDDISINEWWVTNSNLQDGCIYGNNLFLFDSSGNCRIYDVSDKHLLCNVTLPDYKGYLPHSNSVCFGKKLFDSDPFPLIYTNLYNNYPNDKNSYGVCLVYRILFRETYKFELVQVIKIGFTDNLNVWYNNSENESPFGNFLLDGEDLWAYVNIFGSSITRLFKFKKPEIIIGDVTHYCELSLTDIESTFDVGLFRYIQGGVINSGMLYSLEGFGGEVDPALLKSLNLNTHETLSLNLTNTIGNYEPEFIDFYNGSLVIGMYQGVFYCLE